MKTARQQLEALSSPPTGTALILPVKRLADAKRRLVGILSPEERRDLVLAMLADAIGAGRAAGLEPLVLSPDPEVLVFAERAGARTLADPPGAHSLNTALEYALARDCSAREAALILLPDTPLVTASELQALGTADSGEGRPPVGGRAFSAAETSLPASEAWVVLAPDRAKRGTNAALLRPPTAMPLRFGPRSLSQHREMARCVGIRCDERVSPGIALDLDTGADLRQFLARPSDTQTYRFLAARGIAQRLAASAV